MEKIKIAIIDDMVDILDYFTVVLSREADIEIVGSATNGEDGVKLVLEKRPDVVLMDIQMEHKDAGIEAIAEIKREWEDAKVIVLTIHDDDEQLYNAFAAGAVEYLLKTASIGEILNSIHDVHSNQLSLRPEISQKILKEFSKVKSYQNSMLYVVNMLSKLSTSEYEILRDIYNGDTYRMIAKKRCVEEVTVRTQISRMLKKMGFPTMKTAIKKFEELNLFNMLDNK